jgi:NAD(P)-dependent dehydrogenase (short-subunit alcohol dehydrogenase family)
MSRLSGKRAVVTGASKGIGAGIAKGLAAEGAAVVVNYASSRDGADRVVADIKAKADRSSGRKATRSRPVVVGANAGSLASPHKIDQRIEHDPHHVDKAPVEADYADRCVIMGRKLPPPRPHDDPADQNQ